MQSLSLLISIKRQYFFIKEIFDQVIVKWQTLRSNKNSD